MKFLKRLTYLIYTIFFLFLIVSHTNAKEKIFVPQNKVLPKNIYLFNQDYKKLNLNNIFTKNGDYIINFWATWCLPCKKEIPELEKLQLKLKKLKINIDIFLISIDKKKFKKQLFFLKDRKVKNLVPFFDPEMLFFKSMKLRGIPTTILISNRSVIGKKEGLLVLNKKLVDEILEIFN